MRKILALLMGILCTVSLVAFTACNPVESSTSNSSIETPLDSSIVETVTYKLNYQAGGGLGEAPAEEEHEEGAVITLKENPFTNEGYTFNGWSFGEEIYAPGDSYTMPASDVTFVARWEEVIPEPEPKFLQESYAYDRWAGGNMELTVDLDGANLIYLELNGEMLYSSEFSYDEEKACIIINESVMLSLQDGEYVVTAYTDASASENPTCKLTVDNSVKTSFDEVTLKTLRYGYEEGVKFSVVYNGSEVKSIKCGEMEVPAEYYEVVEDGFIIKAEFIKYFNGEKEYTVTLSNNDVYTFKIASNVLFATDYDYNTIHDTAQSNIGHNPLYQYTDNVSIVDGPEGMSGKVLKITPNTTEVQYDCNGYFTLATLDYANKTTWYNVGFTSDKIYAISFDYMTEGTSKGTFVYKDPHSNWSRTLLMGAEKDGVVHHFAEVIKGSDLVHGLYLYANFIGGGGNVYVDNFRVSEIEGLPTLTANGNYNLIGDYSFAFNNAGLKYEVKLNGEAVETAYDSTANTLTIGAEIAEKLSAGVHILTVETVFATLTAELRVVDNRVATLTQTSASYYSSTQESVELAGSFTEGLKIVSVKAKDVTYDNGYAGGWDFYHANVDANYAEYVTLVGGLNGTGKLIVSGELIDMFWGATTFVAEISNGASIEFTVNNEEVIFNSNYDALTMKGWLGDYEHPGSPLSSGLNGTQAIEARADGKGNALFFHSTESSADRAALTLKLTNHVWAWYYLYGDNQHLYRITFEYQTANFNEKDAYFYFILPNGIDVNTVVFGAYDEVYQAHDWQEVRYYLNNDGAVHTLDSGWFGYNQDVVNLKIQLPEYLNGSNSYFMLDEVKVVKTADILMNLSDYQIKQAGEFGFNGDGFAVTSVKVDGADLAYEVKDGKVLLSKDALDLLSIGSHKLEVVTAKCVYSKSFAISDSRVSNLTVTSIDVRYGQTSVKLAGEFSENLNIVSIARTGADGVWDRNGNMNPAYITIEADGLVIGNEIIAKAYKTGSYQVTFDNGKSVEFTLNSNVIYYSDYDEVNVFVDIPGNSVICQDREMISFVETENGNHAIKYHPETAVQGHSIGAINGGRDNFIFTFENRPLNNYNWYDLYFNSGDVVIFFFDYEVFANDKTPNYQFTWIDANTNFNTVKLEGKGTFYIELPACNLKALGINCPAASPDEVSGTYMYIDNIGIGIHSDAYLSEYSKTVSYGATQSVTFAGSFDSSLSIESVSRFGTNFWDNSKTVAKEVNKNYFTLSENGLTVSADLINQVYDTMTFWVNLSNGDTVRVQLTSNLWFYTDWDEVYVQEETLGNVASCQDTNVRSILTGENGYLKYHPEYTQYGHSSAAINGGDPWNAVQTFANSSYVQEWWHMAFPMDKTLIVFFDYEVFANDKTPNYQFNYWNSSDQIISTALSGSGHFYVEIPVSDVKRFFINCPAATPDAVTGTYLNIDNFGFGIK